MSENIDRQTERERKRERETVPLNGARRRDASQTLATQNVRQPPYNATTLASFRQQLLSLSFFFLPILPSSFRFFLPPFSSLRTVSYPPILFCSLFSIDPPLSHCFAHSPLLFICLSPFRNPRGASVHLPHPTSRFFLLFLLVSCVCFSLVLA